MYVAVVCAHCPVKTQICIEHLVVPIDKPKIKKKGEENSSDLLETHFNPLFAVSCKIPGFSSLLSR